MLIVVNDMYEINRLKAHLSGEFEIRTWVLRIKFLGWKFKGIGKVGKLSLSQKEYPEKVLEYFDMQSSKLVSTPLATHFKLSTAFYTTN